MKLVASDFMSLDGVVQAPGGKDEDLNGGFAHGGWSMPYFDPEAMGAAFDRTIKSTSALLFGRRTWEGMAAAWPGRAGDPFADHMNSIPKYVASRTLAQEDLHWSNSTLLPPDDALGSVRRLREERDGEDRDREERETETDREETETEKRERQRREGDRDERETEKRERQRK